MGQVIVVANQRGGVAKTTTCLVLAACFRAKGLKVLNIDADPQGDTSFSMGADDTNSLYEVMCNNIDVESSIQVTEQGDIIPASILLSSADSKFLGKQYILRKALSKLKDKYDYIIIDTPPSLGILTTNALTCADSLLIPVGADVYSLKGMDSLYDTVEIIKEDSNPDLNILGVLIIKYSQRLKLNKGIKTSIETLANSWGCRVFETQIRESVLVKESQVKQVSILKYAPNSKPAIDYMTVADEILSINK